MDLSHLFDISPFLALSFCVCLGTVVWCTILVRRGCHHVADRFLIGFIGLLALYECAQILQRGGILYVPHMRHYDEAINFLVNSLYLLAALILRVSNHDRYETIFRLRLAEAQPLRKLNDARDAGFDPATLDQIRSALTLLSANALKLYIHISLHTDRRTGLLEANENDLLKAACNDRKLLIAAFKELREKGLCEIEVEQVNRPIRIVSLRQQTAQLPTP